MKNISEDLKSLMAEYPLYSQETTKEILVIVKLCALASSATWWLTEYDPETKTAFGFVT